MGYPTKRQWQQAFRRIPLWAVVLLVVLLYGRLVMIALWHWLGG
ncbi:MAG: hypothetical protein QNJ22_20830 [Desulfosarcinaceae bacterium]|nr:hypothetical protein [Desulfosarcinaceae bacterium]